MTPKQQILKLYPISRLVNLSGYYEIWSFDKDPISLEHTFSIKVFNNKNKTPRQAWADAWNRISRTMLKKLEQ